MRALPRRSPRAPIGAAFALVLALALPGAALAQPAALADEARPVVASAHTRLTSESATAPAARAAGPLLAGTRAGAVPAEARDAGPAQASDVAMQRRSGLRESQIMMIVGGAAVVLGFVTGDTAGDILILGGAAVGLAGLYFYLH